MRVQNSEMAAIAVKKVTFASGVDNQAFYNVLQEKTGSKRDAYLPSKQSSSLQSETYKRVLYRKSQKLDTSSVQSVESDRYRVEEKEGSIVIYDKKYRESFQWRIQWDDSVRVDKDTGKKFLINNHGKGIFEMIPVDGELEGLLERAFGVEELKEKPLLNYTVQKDQKTGIYYVTANGYEWQGGAVILDEEAREMLDSMAKEYMKQYPGLIRNYDEAWYYASLEVMGLVKRTANGIIILDKDRITFKDRNAEENWKIFLDEMYWEAVKGIFDKTKVDDSKLPQDWKNTLKDFSIFKESMGTPIGMK